MSAKSKRITRLVVYLLCVPIKLFVTICTASLMAIYIASDFTLDGDNREIRIAKELIKEIWV